VNEMQRAILIFGSFLLLLTTTIITTTTIASSSYSILNDERDSSNTLIQLATKNVQEAADAGADVSSLIEKFNNAIGVLGEAQEPDSNACSFQACITETNKVLESVVHDATVLKQQAENESYYRRVTNFIVLAPLGAFVGALLTNYLYRKWRLHLNNKFMDMEIREKQDT
jgi:hypothetical protein